MKFSISLILISVLLSACKSDIEDPSCFDPNLVHEDACTADCPGFLGCDGQNYCNQCEAARKGIGPA